VERTDDNRDRQPSRQAERGRGGNDSREEPSRPTPSKAEGEVSDVEQALKNQRE
jgi:hypothetical protein